MFAHLLWENRQMQSKGSNSNPPKGARRRGENQDHKANNTRPLSERAEATETQWLCAGCKADRAKRPGHKSTQPPPRSANGVGNAALSTSYANPRQRQNQGRQRIVKEKAESLQQALDDLPEDSPLHSNLEKEQAMEDAAKAVEKAKQEAEEAQNGGRSGRGHRNCAQARLGRRVRFT